MLEKSLMLSKFRGSLLGALVGDCCGAPFEGQLMDSGVKLILKKNLDKLEGPDFSAPYKKYTDDTAMTIQTAKTFLDPAGYSQKLLAKNYVVEFFKEPNRGYGEAVGEVFEKLRQTKIADPTCPAIAQFNGSGSFGNGAAMRVSPVALYCVNKSIDELVRLVKETSQVTHTNVLGVNGAILQALAIRQSFLLNPNEPFCWKTFLAQLQQHMVEIEKENDPDLDANPNAYEKQLQNMEKLLDNTVEPSDENVLNLMGHSVAALYSVPTAVYCFLRHTQDLLKDTDRKSFRNTLEYAISLGGDCDTIGSMACAISGAYYGESIISSALLKHCESAENVAFLGEQLFKVAGAEIM
ncbi:ADP-ribosylhydrolase ARH3-like [Anopheles marshallii]|uniref:ADP-ribosylhydrolase ARH3-like n=1 Tax=Anopheles marshallii TaxID=1521116 RepID=UPI00237A79C9|nr:ADP-ribosylhydrolase ARH3-like [Anopheles marshallii]